MTKKIPASIRPVVIQLLFLIVGFYCSQVCFSQAPAEKGLFRITGTNGKKTGTVYGKSVGWDGTWMNVMTRGGHLIDLHLDPAKDIKKVADKFVPLSKKKLVAKLKKEFGSKYAVSTTNHFVVVHPIGEFKVWAQPFEDLAVQFKAYFKTRGVYLDKPEFTMVAVVLNTRAEFNRMTAKHKIGSGVVGYYSSTSNRVITYDPTNGRGTVSLADLETVVHEATHQTAYNFGLHTRGGNAPRWLKEGLATMFEARGVHNCFKYSQRSDRLNVDQLYWIQQYIKSGAAKGNLERMVRNDRLFSADADFAYAYAWGMTFFLAETQPHAYFKFLKNDGNTSGSSGTKSDAVKRFADSFGANFDNLEATMLKFLAEQEIPPQWRGRGRHKAVANR